MMVRKRHCEKIIFAAFSVLVREIVKYKSV